MNFMSCFYRTGVAMLVLTVMVTLTACGPTSQTIKGATINADISGLELDKSQEPTLVFKRPGAPTLKDYNRFIIDPVTVEYSDPEMKELEPEDIGRMQQYSRKAMIQELRDGGYQVGTRSEANTMRISLSITGLKAPTAIPNVVAALAPIAVSVGEVTVKGVFREAMTNRIDAVVIDRSQGSRVLNPSPWSTWSDVEKAFDNWAEGVRKAIDKAHGR